MTVVGSQLDNHAVDIGIPFEILVKLELCLGFRNQRIAFIDINISGYRYTFSHACNGIG